MWWIRTVIYLSRCICEYVQIEKKTASSHPEERQCASCAPHFCLSEERVYKMSCIIASKYLVKLGGKKRSFSVSIWPCRFALNMWCIKADLKTQNNLKFHMKTGWSLEKRSYCLELKEWFWLHLDAPRVSLVDRCSVIKKWESEFFFFSLV